MRYVSMIMAVLMIFCGCQNSYQQTNNIMQKLPEEAASQSVNAAETNTAGSAATEVTQPPCLACEEEPKIINENPNKEKYYSNEPAKQSWLTAYKSFYSLKPESIEEILKSAAAHSSYEKAMRGLEIRSDMGIDFIYPIYTMDFADIDTIAKDAQQVKSVIRDFRAGALVNYKQNGSFAGEIYFDAKQLTKRGFEENLHPYPAFRPFEVGDYFYRHSLTVTEGLEAQLTDFGFIPENTHAFALWFLIGSMNQEYGICFYDGEKAAFYNQGIEHDYSLSNKLYSFKELSDALCEIYDVCSVAEIDERYNKIVLEPGTGGFIPNIDDDNRKWRGDEVVNPVAAKPVIYLYPEHETEVSVKLGYPKEYFTYTYPEYNDGWYVTAYPDGRIVNKSDNTEHYYLFWEGDKKINWDMSEGFVVKGSNVTDFLREKLSYMGLTPREYNDFITYWAPEMIQNKYNLISFSWEQYEELAPLEITPKPDNIFRVHMVYKAIEKPFEITEQQLPVFDRNGFSVLEWGGSRA